MEKLEDKEIEFAEYVAKQIKATNTSDDGAVRRLSYMLIDDFKDECESFNSAVTEDMLRTNEELEELKEATKRAISALRLADD